MNRDPSSSAADPKGLVRESYRIDGISEGECRSILTEWALSLPPEQDDRAAIAALLRQHGAKMPDHPMTALLQAALDAPPSLPRRRGGRAARLREG